MYIRVNQNGTLNASKAKDKGSAMKINLGCLSILLLILKKTIIKLMMMIEFTRI